MNTQQPHERPKRYELTFDRKTKVCEPRESVKGRFMLSEEVIPAVEQLEAKLLDSQKEIVDFRSIDRHKDKDWDKWYKLYYSKVDEIAAQKETIEKMSGLIELAIGFSVAFREDNDCWQKHQDVGILFAKLTTGLKALHPNLSKDKPIGYCKEPGCDGH